MREEDVIKIASLIIPITVLFAVQVNASDFPKTSKKTANIYVGKIRKLLSEGRKMEPLRLSLSQEDQRVCMDKMRRFQLIADALIKEGESFSLTAANISFRSAANHAKFCVSCVSSAIHDCDMVEPEIKKGFKYLDAE